MGQKNTYICTGCDYEVMIAAGPDAGMIAATNTFVCLDCKIITDMMVSRYSRLREDSGQTAEVQNSIKFKCNECGGFNIKEWDSKRKPCPKCGSRMRKSNEGFTILWD